MKHKGLLLAISCLLCVAFSSVSFATGQEYKLSAKRQVQNFTVMGDVDYRREEGHLFRRHYGVGVRMPLNDVSKGLSLGVHYRSVYTPADEGGWDLEKRPYVQLQKTFKTASYQSLPSLKWALRTRHEFRFRQNKDDSRRNRVKIKVKSETPFFNAYPFVGNEYYYDFLKDELTKVSVDLGVEFLKINGIKPSLYYKYTSTYKSEQWEPYSAVVLKFAF